VFGLLSKFVYRFWKEILLVGVLVSILMTYLSLQMSIKTDLLVLLPHNDPYSQRYKELFTGETVSETMMIVVEIDGKTFEAMEAAAQIKNELEKLTGIVKSFRKLDTISLMGPAGIMLTHANLFEKLSSTLNFLNFLIANPAAVDFGIIRQMGISMNKVMDLLREMERIESLDKYALISDDSQILTMTVVLTRPALDLAFTQRAVSLLKEKVGAILKPYGFSFGFSGSHQGALDSQRIIFGDFSVTTLLTLGLITVLFLVSYGNISITLGIFLTLVTGSVFSLGAFYLIFQSLEFTSSFVLALLLGLGIDFGIHLSNRSMEYLLENYPGFNALSRKKKQEAMREAVQYAIQSAGKGIFTGALTTIAAFLSMVFVDSPGLQHIGLMTGLGISLFFVSMVLLLPGWLVLFSTFMRIRTPKADRERKREGRFRGYYSRFSRWVILSTTLLAIPCAVLTIINFIHFDYTPTKALPDEIESIKTLRALQKHGLGFSVDDSIVAFVEDPLKLYAIEETLRKESKYIGSVVSLATYLPRSVIEDFDSFRQETVRVLNDAQNAFTLIALKRLNVYDEIEEILGILVKSKNFAHFAELLFKSALFPPEVKDFFTMEIDGKLNFRVYAFTNTNIWQHNRLKHYVEELNEIGFQFYGYPIIYYQITKKVISSIVFSVLVALVMIVVPVVVTLRDFQLTFLALLALILNLVILFGLSYLFGTGLNFMTLLGLPLLLGMAIDAPVHLLLRYKDERSKGSQWHTDDFLKQVFLGTGKAITLSALTTAIAFFSFLIASSPLLLEFGVMLGTGIMINWLLTFLWVGGIRIAIDQKRKTEGKQE